MKKNKQGQNKSTRNSNIELLRILCIISIILHHSYVHSKINIGANNFNFISLYLIQILGIISNNIFILITGYYMANKKIKIRNILKLVLEAIFYSYIIMLIYVIFSKNINISMIIASIIPIMSNAEWFITGYILLYISIPFINILIDNISKKQYIYLIMILITCFSILPTINLLKQYFSNYIWFITLYLIGAYMKKYKEDTVQLLKKNDLLFIGSTISLASLMLMKLVLQINDILIFSISNFIMFVLGLSVFISFINKKEFNNSIINYIASSSLGIYLIHDNFIVRPLLWKKINIGAHMKSPYFWLYEIGIVLLIFTICLVIDKIRQRFIEKPLLDFIDSKMNQLEEKLKNKKERKRKGRENMKLLMHTCCAPCSVYCIDSLRNKGIEPTLYWYNPNIHPYMEYKTRRDTLKEYSKMININLIVNEEYGLDNFCKNVISDLENRCVNYCYRVRLEQTVKYAKENGYDAFTSTLFVSPYQKHEELKKLCEELSKKYEIQFLYRDFRIGFREGQTKARELGLYMQKYCGCIFSEEDRYSNKIKKDLENMRKQ